MKNEIYKELERRIVKGIYQPGEFIREADLAAEFNVSRTPIREVLQDLQRQRLITLYRYQCAQVTFMILEFYYQAIAVKEELEEMALRLAAEKIQPAEIVELRKIEKQCEMIQSDKTSPTYFEDMLTIDTEFHRIIRKAGRNEVLSGLVEDLQIHIERYYFYTRDVAEPTLDGFTEQFRAIIDALEKHDGVEALAALRRHMHGFYEIVEGYYK